MLDKLTSGLDFQANALVLRAERQQLLAGNIANADTPGYAAKDMNFAQALREASQAASGTAPAPVSATHARHLPVLGGSAAAQLHQSAYTVQTQPSMDGNSVDLDRERAAFADNAVRYEATLRFINGQGKTLLAAIQGQ
ncbi:flagellar basal body rod protein FlgB [Xenophilus arseniciresistens]|uniref:Flagellar basal body rod protein FlgB n=1 Tax=Xenophilus arseniciresistens TaxID=1283306 RepID=A0AAE3SY95_9BURK|nr:flagellar basal body rod protein FlgB [Xenophilus arseniciresistens]MDA7415250.1 flagellar basal body rod protein FlgB [Xenophilus arseniciresistens]